MQDKDLTELVTQGFLSLDKQLREGDAERQKASERLLRVELAVEQMKVSLAKLERDQEIDNLRNRVQNLEAFKAESEDKVKENRRWRFGLLAGIIILLLGFLRNAIRIDFQ